jgi:alkenylglycerophosphocholine/alkenylglycerophosphoethanolamine hydrolase
VHIALLIATALAAVTNWWSRVAHSDRVELWAKPLTTVLVICLALVSGAPVSQIAVAVVALSFCLLGDIALMPAVDNFILGLASFLLGHLVFIVLFVQYGLHRPTLAGLALLALVMMVTTVGRIIVLSAGRRQPKLQLPVAAYLVVISAMAVFGWSTGLGWVIAGTTLFVLSDAILGWGEFVKDRPWMSLAIMVTYHGAIASLALSLW